MKASVKTYRKANIKKRFELVKSVVEQEWARVLFSDEGKLELFWKSRTVYVRRKSGFNYILR